MKYEIHTHSTFSDGMATPKKIIEHAKKSLDGIAITDHNNINGSLHITDKDIDIITGLEVSSNDGHILALGVDKQIKSYMSAKETVEMIHSLDGIAVAAHPYDRYRSGVGDLILNIPFDGIEIFNGHTFTNKISVESLCKQHGLSMVGGSDAHTIREIGNVTIEFEGDWRKAIIKGKCNVVKRPLPLILLTHGLFITKNLNSYIGLK